MFQIYQRRFWRESPSPSASASPLPLRLVTAAVALVVLATGLWPEPLLVISGSAAEALLAKAHG
jgi:multicomponent Na+:H+ antiporter subunit D